jgi:ribosome-binding factor A
MGIGTQRVAAKIKADIAHLLRAEVKDPRLSGLVTVIDVDLSSDYRHAKVKVSILAKSDGEERKILRALSDATGFIQRRVAGGLRTRVTPQLEFVQDKGAEQSVHMSSLLDEIREEREAREAEQFLRTGDWSDWDDWSGW